ncbi:MAG TPA: sialidase family protein [Vicinamibacterales bacterium]|nr:sialidase family protein [Vicinamibacterales bacterium]
MLGCLLLVVSNGGAVQVSRVTPLDVPGRSSSTPWVAAAGPFVAVAWGASISGKTDVFVAVSRDGGTTFGSPVQVNRVAGEARLGGEMPPRIALVPEGASRVPAIVVVWTARGKNTEIKTARSRDGGRTFGSPVTLQSPGAQGDRGWPAVALDRDGTAHVLWLDHRGLAASTGAGSGHAGHRSGAAHDGVAMAQRSGLYYASANRTSSAERELANGVCYCCKTAMVAASDGAIFGAWRHVYPGNLRDIAFTVSLDGGKSFSTPVRVSQDEWAIEGCPDDGPAMDVDREGTAHVVWPTRIGGANPQGALFYASTRDGRAFTPRIRIPTLGSLKPSHPQIVVNNRGRIVVAWDETVGGQRVASARELRVGAEASFGAVVTLAPEGRALYPVLAAADTGLVAVWATGGAPSRVLARRFELP